MNRELIDTEKETERKKFNWWHLWIDGIISSILSFLCMIAIMYLHAYFYYQNNMKFNEFDTGLEKYGLPIPFLKSESFDVTIINRISWVEFLLNFLFYFAIILFFLRYKNIKLSKRN